MRRLTIIAVVFVVTLATLIGVARIRWLEPAMTAGRTIAEHRRRIERQLAAPRPAADRHVLFMGDSSIMSIPDIPSWPVLTTRQLASHAVAGVQNVYPGQDLFHHYCVLPAYLPREPEVVVIVVNMRVMFPNRRDGVAMDLCTFLPPATLARSLLLPWYDRQASLVRVALMRTLRVPWIERSVLFVTGARRLFVDRWMPEPAHLISQHALSKRRADYYDQAITPRQPMVRMLHALVARVRRAGAEAVVVVSPVPLEWLRNFVPVDPHVWERRMAVLRTAVEDAGGTLLDLHALLGAAAFRDDGGHMTAAGHVRIANAVGPVIHGLLRLPPPEALPIRTASPRPAPDPAPAP